MIYQSGGRAQSGQAGEIYGRLRVSRAAEHSLVLCVKRMHMARSSEVRRLGVWIRQMAQRGGTVMG